MPERRTVALVTLGCARNEVDSEELAGRLEADGWDLVEDAADADVAVVNTCGFVEAAKKDSVDALLEANDLKGHGRTQAVVAVGCMAERYGRELADSMPEAQAVLGTIGAALLTPDTRAGQVNDALQLTTLAINNGNTMLWFGEHGVTQVGEPLTYSSAVFLAANSVLSTVNFAARAGYHTGLAQPALLGARLRKFVMNAYSVGAVPLAVADMMHTGGVVGAIEAGSLAVFGIGAHLQSRNEQKLINAEKNRLAKAADPDAVDKPVTPWLAQKWDFFGRAMPKGLVLLGGGVIVNFGAKILVELLKDEDKGAPTPTPTPTPAPSGGPSTPPATDPGGSTPPKDPPKEPPKEPPSETPRERPAYGSVRVQPYSPDHVAGSTLWGIAGAHLDTLLSEGQKAEAQAQAMTPDQQVANFALRELINLNPRYRLADNPDHLEPGWELDVTR